MGFWSRVGSFIGEAASTVKRAANAAWETAKDVASRAVGWMAEEAEKFVEDVKHTWQIVKPYVEHIRAGLRTAAALTTEIPFLSAALLALDKGLGALTAFENSPIAKKVNEAIAWAIKLAQRWKKSTQGEQESERLSEEELRTAKRHQDDLRAAEREVDSEPLRHQMELASVINDFEIARTDLANAIDAAPANFEHYLRLRATQKLLGMADRTLRAAQTIDDISVDDIFLVRIASDLIKSNPELGKEAALRLDSLLQQRYGKKLTPFVFEELIASWAMRAEQLGKRWDEANRSFSKDKILLKRLTIARDIQDELSEEETLELANLEKNVPLLKQQLDDVARQQRDIERYTGAAEGFLQLLEKTPEQIEQEDREYLIEDGALVGKILIDCAQNNVPFNELDSEQQALVNDYANIFKRESQARTELLLKAAA
ncbi:hypothetical protein [Paraburkholderia xenovorans]|uniref:hypothetical protein n=1 Tax=Paraburkholderia xenovorans TaxID=36873 RepID=UPI0015C558C7|nr:hypothetical protein [Paraburkholderia xenovorans]NPT37861.1 hypothetical protein [Paraburkholderia xenovorans]